MSKFIIKLALIPLSIALISSSGCKNCNGFDASALKVDAAVNYGQLVKNHEIPVEAIVYGQIRPDDGGGSTTRSEVLLDNIVKDIHDIKKLDNNPDLPSFSDSLEQEFKTNFDILNVHNSAKAAKALALSIELYVKTSGKLPKLISDGERYVPDEKKGSYRDLSAQLTKDVQSFYQTALGLSLALSQQSSIRELSSLATIIGLLKALMNETLFSTQADNQAAHLVLLELEAERNNVYTYALKFVDTEVNVAPSFTAAVNSLKTALSRLKRDYIDKVDAAFKSDVDGYYDIMDTAVKSLENLALDYPPIEALKTSSDPKIEGLIADLKNTALAINALPNKTLTDINQLTKKLGDNDVVVIPHNNKSKLIAYALASSVVYHIAKEYGLPNIDNVIYIDASKLNDLKKDMNIDDRDFNIFLKSYAASMAREYNEGSYNNYNNIFIISADEIEGDVNVMLEELINKAKILLITSYPDKYSKAKAFVNHRHLKIPEAMPITLALLQEKKADNAVYIAERLAKIAAAFNKLDIANIRSLVLGVLTRLNGQNLDEAINNALADAGVDREAVVNSGVEADSPLVVEANIKSSSSHYVSKAKRPTSDDMASKKLQAMRALNNNLLANTQNQDLGNAIIDKKTKLKDAVNLIKPAYNNKKALYDDVTRNIQPALFSRRINEVNSYLSDILTMAQYCSVPESHTRAGAGTDPVAENIRVSIDKKWPEAVRKKMADANFATRPVLNDKLGKAVWGKPDITAGEEESLVSCLIFNPRYKPSVGSSLFVNKFSLYHKEIIQYITSLQTGIDTCYQFADFFKQNQCLKDKRESFAKYRQSLALDVNANTSILRDLTKAIGVFPKHDGNSNTANNQRDIFWTKPWAMPALLLVGDKGKGIATWPNAPNSLVEFLSKPTPPDEYDKSFYMLNQTYYIRELAYLTGSNHGRIYLSDYIPANVAPTTVLSPTSLIDTILNSAGFIVDMASADANNRYYFHLKQTLAGFDDNAALLVKTERALNQGYEHVVAYHLARIIYKDIITNIENKVAKAFWNLSINDLKQFQENGPPLSPKAIRKDIWDKIDNIPVLFEDLAQKLEKPLVELGDGSTGEGHPDDANTSGLMELGKAYVALHNELIDLETLLNPTTPAINTLDPSLKTKLTTMHTSLSNLIVSMNLNNANPPWAAVPAYASPTGSIAKEFMAAFEDAYDLHVYNIFNMSYESLNVAAAHPPRNYPIWHSKNNTIANSLYNRAKVQADAEVLASGKGATAPEATNIVNAAIGDIANSCASVLATAKAAKGLAPDQAATTAALEVFTRLKKRNEVRHPLEPR